MCRKSPRPLSKSLSEKESDPDAHVGGDATKLVSSVFAALSDCSLYMSKEKEKEAKREGGLHYAEK